MRCNLVTVITISNHQGFNNHPASRNSIHDNEHGFSFTSIYKRGASYEKITFLNR